MGKDTLWKNRPFGWFLSSLGGFPVTRGTADREALRRCVAVLEAGEPLVLFPEGERKSGPTVQPLFDGAVYVALRAGVPIVPVGIGGSERVMPKGARFLHPHKVHVIVGAPIELPATGRLRPCPALDDPPPQRRAARHPAAVVRRRPATRRAAGARNGPRSAPIGAEGGHQVRRVGGAAQLSGGVHRQLRHADVDRGDSEPGRRQRADRRPARDVVA